MGYIVLYNVVFDETPANNVLANIKYRLTSDPDVTNWTTYPHVVTILPSGNFSPPVVISGLITAENYTIMVTPVCGSGGADFTGVAGIITTTTTSTTTTSTSTTTTSTSTTTTTSSTTTTTTEPTTTTTSSTTTTTTAPTYNFLVTNSSITTVEDINVGGAYPYVIVTGAYPLGPASNIEGTHVGFTGAITVNETIGDCRAILYVNTVEIECINLMTSPVSFASRTYLSTDVIEIAIHTGACGT